MIWQPQQTDEFISVYRRLICSDGISAVSIKFVPLIAQHSFPMRRILLFTHSFSAEIPTELSTFKDLVILYAMLWQVKFFPWRDVQLK